MDLLSEEVGLEAEQDFGTLDLAQIETLCCYLRRVRHHGIDVRSQEITELLGFHNDLLQNLFFFRLER